MTNLEKIELSPPVFPQASGTDTINMHDVHIMGNKYLLMNVGKYVDEEIGDEIVGYLRFNDGSVITSIPYYITPDKQDFSPYSLLFPVDKITLYGSYQAQYKIISHGNERDSPTVNVNLVFSDSSSLIEVSLKDGSTIFNGQSIYLIVTIKTGDPNILSEISKFKIEDQSKSIHQVIYEPFVKNFTSQEKHGHSILLLTFDNSQSLTEIPFKVVAYDKNERQGESANVF
ncbi:hypothetical protein [Xenorhabdus sp. IM139775]|uniref:hypothetical protein n=1 Tax=Xenorhabdus sp. IM139775 TaxID=3025876 RepID=UPI0023594A6C|nr:hypothetical protein [Xenorhabdus sp. IM139775]MDC9594914.1 hypothetical protein [Xenorhabdus sp. IM139775]